MLNVDQSQRRDIDTTLDDRLTLAIDEENIADNPYIFEPTSFVGNNWFKQGSNIVKLNLVEQDSIVFVSAPLVKLLQKDITNVIVSFDYNISNVSVNYPILSNISLTCMEMTNYMLVENILTTQGHIDVDCSLFNFSSNVVNTTISEQGFKVGINLVGNKSNATIKLSNVQIQFKYQNKLATQEDSVVNRLEPHIDFYRDGDGDLILQIGGDASGKGIDHSSGDIDTYSKTEIDNKLATKVNVEIGKGLSSNDYTLTEKTKLGTVETNANYYVHPSSHQTGMITESSALTNLETSENATQHEINLAIDSKINSVGGSVDWSDIQNKPSDYPPSTHNHDDRYYTESEVDTALNNKQDTLVSGTSIKTINNTSLLGSGNISIGGGGSSVDIATTWGNPTSDSKVPSEKLAKDSLDTKANSNHTHTKSEITDFPSIPSKTSDLTNDGDGSNVFVKDNDSRLSDARTPLAHTHLSSDVTDLIDVIYPVGSIYMSVNSVNPSNLFGGTWEQIKDTFLLASGDTYANGSTGGEATHTLTTNEMPSHTHIQDSHNHTQNAHNHTQNPHSHTIGSLARYVANGGAVAAVGDGYGNSKNYKTGNTTATNKEATATNNPQTATNQNTGGGQAHNNMPPYLTVNVWKRTA